MPQGQSDPQKKPNCSDGNAAKSQKRLCHSKPGKSNEFEMAIVKILEAARREDTGLVHPLSAM